ncbi:MAG: hypothetical protein EXS48_03580 [Candidatus Staskawiczbacteria bacterium]|nr:hypothetical protein [Candidatus Staskawiczbacteria bacterium]
MENNKISFIIPEETSMAEIIDKILKNNGLEESDEDFFDKTIGDIESNIAIIRDATITTAKNKLPESKVIELLQTHLNIPKQTAEKILQDIKQKLIPFAKIKDVGINEGKEKFREELLNKIRDNVSPTGPEIKLGIPAPYEKKPPVIDVEKNAGIIKQERKPIASQPEKSTPPTPPQEIKPDTYREPIE